jgi:hypothetical protein
VYRIETYCATVTVVHHIGQVVGAAAEQRLLERVEHEVGVHGRRHL